MLFSWRTFCIRNNIEFVDKGPNVAKDNIGIACPFCGDDPSHHMGLKIKGTFWGCWRNKHHRGKRPHRLIMILIHCNYQEADNIIGTGGSPELSEFANAVDSLKRNVRPRTVSATLNMPKEFKPINRDGHGKKFWGYFIRRGFKKADVSKLCEQYGLRYCMTGRWAYRIIFPVYMDGNLVCWTSRTISDREKIRYLSLSTNPDKAKERGDPIATMNIKDTVLWYNDMKGMRGDTFVLTEGPYDALKVDYYGRPHGIKSTCLFSTDLRDTQLLLIDQITYRFRRKIILLDKGQLATAMGLVSDLAHLGFELGDLPRGIDDPGELTRKQVELL